MIEISSIFTRNKETHCNLASPTYVEFKPRRSLQHLLVLFLSTPLMLLLGCDSGPNSNARDYSGTYTGDGIYRLSWTSTSFNTRLNLKVVQSGKELTITGTETLDGVVEQVDAFTGTVNDTGFLTITEGGLSVDGLQNEACGELTLTSDTWVFSPPNLRITQSLQVGACGRISVSALLVRE